MNSHNLTHGHSSQSEGIVVSQVELIGKRQLHNVVDTLNITRLQSHLLELLTVERRVVIHVLCHFHQPAALYLAKLLAIHTLNRLIPNHCLLFSIIVDILVSSSLLSRRKGNANRAEYKIKAHLFLSFHIITFFMQQKKSSPACRRDVIEHKIFFHIS